MTSADPGNSTSSQPASGESLPHTVGAGKPPVTRTGVVWAAVAAGLVLLVLLIIFFIQNQDVVRVTFLGFEGRLALGTALFIAGVGGGILVAIAGGARILQLRRNERKLRRTTSP